MARHNNVFVLMTAAAALALAGCGTSSSGNPGSSPIVTTPAAITLTSNGYTLSFPAVSNGFGLRIHANAGAGADAYSSQPVQMLVCTACTDETQDYPFSGVSYTTATASNGGVLANATYSSSNGSVFAVTDQYTVATTSSTTAGSFQVVRNVVVQTANASDKGFNSEFQLGFKSPVTLAQYHVFAPAMWYDQNANDAQSGAFGTNPANANFYWREQRSALPLVMLQDPSTGSALSIAHINSTPAPGMNNLNAAWQVDSTVQYGSIGLQQAPAVTLGFIYPASEGDGSYNGVQSLASQGQSTNWLRRSHPVATSQSHTYRLLLSMDSSTLSTGGADFKTQYAKTWAEVYGVFNPAVASIPSATVFSDGINLINHYVETVNGATGLPAGRPDSPTVTPQTNPTFEMGFVGQDIPLGYQLVRAGVLNNDATSLANGLAILNFWANNAGQASGLPRSEYNALTKQFTADNVNCPAPLFLRDTTDGMEAMVMAAIFMRQHGMPQLAWEKFAQAYGDWLVANQNMATNNAGSYYRSYTTGGMPYTNTCSPTAYGMGLSNTTNPIRFLVELYFATGSQTYLTAAQAAGKWALANVFNPVQYIGGTDDHNNYIDKQAGVVAIHAALALYDAAVSQNDTASMATWLTAAQQAANYTITWQYAWNFPITLASAPASTTTYPAYQYSGARALGIIATGASSSDISLSYFAYDLYRLHVLLGAPATSDIYLATANELWNNTKLTTQLTGISNQQYGFTNYGMLGEGVDISSQLYSGEMSSVTWLPWLTNAELDPIQRLQDTFHATSPSDAQTQSASALNSENSQIYPSPGSIGWGK